jgi:hypothetical protein
MHTSKDLFVSPLIVGYFKVCVLAENLLEKQRKTTKILWEYPASLNEISKYTHISRALKEEWNIYINFNFVLFCFVCKFIVFYVHCVACG